MLHSNATKNHVIHAFSYANATARLAATGFTSADINKLCLQTDTNEFYMLTATTPTWVKVAGVTFESALGNPTSDGYVLSSTASGVRSWVPPGGGGGGGAGNSYFPDLVVPNLADWTAINGGAATTIDGTSKGIFVRVDTVSGQSIARIGHYRTAPSTPYTKTLGVVPMLFNTNTCTGIGFREILERI